MVVDTNCFTKLDIDMVSYEQAASKWRKMKRV